MSMQTAVFMGMALVVVYAAIALVVALRTSSENPSHIGSSKSGTAR